MASMIGTQHQAHQIQDQAQMVANAIVTVEAKQAARNAVLKDEVVQAYAYHRMLADDSAPSSDDGEYTQNDDSDDSVSEFDSSDSDEDEGDEGEGEGTEGNDPKTATTARVPMTNPLWKTLWTIQFNTPLLSPASQRGRSCENAVIREGLWGRHPEFGDLTALNMGLLSQLAHLCIASRLRACSRTACLAKAKVMEPTAPNCDWKPFRLWAVTAMSCQASMEHEKCLTTAYAHITSAANGCAMMVKSFKVKDKKSALQPFLDGDGGDENYRIDLVEVMDIIYWMARTQGRKGIGPRKFGHWTRGILPWEVNLPPIERALRYIEKTNEFKICKHRLWKLVDDSERKQDDLPDIVRAIRRGCLIHEGHERCAANKCQESHMNTDGMGQMHKCLPKMFGNTEILPLEYCHEVIQFPVEQLLTAIETEKSTAWLLDKRRLKGPNDKHLAISHVWSDGTGQKSVGIVNKCLFDYFAVWAEKLGCTAVWWDVISNPQEGEARAKALNKMHYNYQEAEYTLIHDKSLLNVDWSEDGTPCVALVLSSWFTRAWTALELSMSRKWRVKVIFRDPTTKKQILKDLDKDILAKSPETCSRVHWLATTLIQNLRKYPVDNVGDLLAILSPRSTSFVRDRTKIAALLTDVPGCDMKQNESVITQDIIKYLGQIPYTCLMHGKPTMADRGGFSWCAATLDHMPVDVSKDMGDTSETKYISIDQDGAADGNWYCRSIENRERQTIHPYGDDLSSAVKVQVALQHWETCLLLKVLNTGRPDLALLVVPFGFRNPNSGSRVLECRYVGAVLDGDEKANLRSPLWTNCPIRLGGADASQPPLTRNSWAALKEMDPTNVYCQPSASSSADECKGHNPDWLGNSYPPHSTQQLDPNERSPLDPNSEHLRRDLRKDLRKAVIKSDRNATRWLVSKDVTLEPDDLMELIKDSYSDDSPRKLDLVKINKLGDVLVEKADKMRSPTNAVYRAAINVYERVNNEYELAVKDKKNSQISNTLDQYRVKYSLGSAYLKVGTMEDEAEKLFTTVLGMCDGPTPASTSVNTLPLTMNALNFATNPNQVKPSQATGATSSALKPKALGEAEKKKQAVDTAWARLRLNTIAKLTILYTSHHNFMEASGVFRRSIEESDKLKLQNDDEVFRINWTTRDRQTFQCRRARDKKMSTLYAGALQSADTMFHKNHVLSLISALYMGVNQSLQDKFQEAKDFLERAELGFKEQLKDGETPMLDLTLYHFGVLWTQRGEPDEARKKLNEAFRRISKTKPEHWLCGAIMLAQAQNDLSCTPPRYLEAKNGFLATTNRPYKRDADDEEASLVTPASLGLSRVLLAEGSREDARELCDTIIRKRWKRYRRRDFLQDYEILAVLAEIGEGERKLAEAQTDIEDAMKGFHKLNGEFSLAYLAAVTRLSSIYEKLGRRDYAEMKLKEVIKGYEKTLGSHHHQTLNTSLQLGLLHLRQQKLKEAEIACYRARKGFDETQGPDGVQTMVATRALGDIYKSHGRFTEAKKMYAAYDSFIRHSAHEASPAHKVRSMLNLGEITALVDDPVDRHRVGEMFDQALKISRNTNASLYYEALLKRGIMYKQQGLFNEAVQHMQRALDGCKSQINKPSEDPNIRLKVLEAMLALGHVGFLRRKKDIPFEKLIKDAQEGIHESPDAEISLKIEAWTVLAELHLREEKAAANGQTCLKAALEIARSGLPLGHPTTVRLTNRLIQLYSAKDRENPAEVDALRKKMFQDLKEAYGEKDAITIQHMTILGGEH